MVTSYDILINTNKYYEVYEPCSSSFHAFFASNILLNCSTYVSCVYDPD